MTMRVALLRGINVGGGNRVPMAELRALAEGLGWREVATWLHSGNLVFAADEDDPETRLELAIAGRFGLAIPVAVRTAAQWRTLLAANPFPDAAEAEPARLMVTIAKQPLAPGAREELAERAIAGERVEVAGGALWIHYAKGASGSKLMPGLIDRIAGSPCTSRNWRTAGRIGRMLETG